MTAHNFLYTHPSNSVLMPKHGYLLSHHTVGLDPLLIGCNMDESARYHEPNRNEYTCQSEDIVWNW